jgi:hypothetical protein
MGLRRTSMSTLFLKHKVREYDSWRPAYDRHAGARSEAGLREIGVYRDSRDPNDLLIVWTVDDLNKAKTFIGSPDLKSRMKEAGVVGDPKFWFAD